jgi:hypothetical protein
MRMAIRVNRMRDFRMVEKMVCLKTKSKGRKLSQKTAKKTLQCPKKALLKTCLHHQVA